MCMYQNDKTIQHLIQEEFSIYINQAFMFSLFDHKHVYIHNFLKHLSLDWLYENRKKMYMQLSVFKYFSSHLNIPQIIY